MAKNIPELQTLEIRIKSNIKTEISGRRYMIRIMNRTHRFNINMVKCRRIKRRICINKTRIETN